MKLRVPLCAVGAEREASFLKTAAELAADAYRSAEFSYSEQREASFHVVAAELAADAHRTPAFASSDSSLLLDHEGESFTPVTASQIAFSDQLSDEHIEWIEFSPAPLTNAPVRGFLVEDEDVATFSPLDDEQFEPGATGSIATVRGEEAETALGGHEDR